MSNSKLIRWAGLSTIMAGALFIFIQVIHPHDDLLSVTSSTWATTHYLTVAMAIFGMLGISGIYARQVQESGWLGLVGFLMFYVWLALTMAFTFVEAFILPLLVTEAPQFVKGFLGLSSGSAGNSNFGALEAASPLSGVLYIFGGLIFGIAIIRAGILPRWAAILLAFGTLSALLVPLLPHGWGRSTVVPVGLGLIWLGYALWSEKRSVTTILEMTPDFGSIS